MGKQNVTLKEKTTEIVVKEKSIQKLTYRIGKAQIIDNKYIVFDDKKVCIKI